MQQGYDEGLFLLSGPSIPPKGGVLIARAETIDELNDYLADEPYCKAKVMRFAKVTEFDPVQHQSIRRDWFGK
ncbi:MAG: YciI family protein [Xanthobacteraceae bacterium]